MRHDICLCLYSSVAFPPRETMKICLKSELQCLSLQLDCHLYTMAPGCLAGRQWPVSVLFIKFHLIEFVLGWWLLLARLRINWLSITSCDLEWTDWQREKVCTSSTKRNSKQIERHPIMIVVISDTRELFTFPQMRFSPHVTERNVVLYPPGDVFSRFLRIWLTQILACGIPRLLIISVRSVGWEVDF